WRIGDGSRIKVMGEPWLRVEDRCWIAAPQSQEKDANMILAVLLVHLVDEDKIIWKEESDDFYSVRSGYQKLMKSSSCIPTHSSKSPTYSSSKYVSSSNKQTIQFSSGDVHLLDTLNAMLTRVFMIQLKCDGMGMVCA
ncbi:hypothetical protein L195_g021350, partial [Trifolium pratense]